MALWRIEKWPEELKVLEAFVFWKEGLIGCVFFCARWYFLREWEISGVCVWFKGIDIIDGFWLQVVFPGISRQQVFESCVWLLYPIDYGGCLWHGSGRGRGERMQGLVSAPLRTLHLRWLRCYWVINHILPGGQMLACWSQARTNYIVWVVSESTCAVSISTISTEVFVDGNKFLFSVKGVWSRSLATGCIYRHGPCGRRCSSPWYETLPTLVTRRWGRSRELKKIAQPVTGVHLS